MGFKSAIQRGFQGKGGNAFKPFRNYVHGKNRAKGKKGGYAGGWAAIAFGNVVNAHSSAEELAIEFEMYTENNPYSPEAYEEAYAYFYAIAELEYQEMIMLYMEEIQILELEIVELLGEAEQLETQAEELRQEAQELIDEAEMCEDPEEVMELLEEAQELIDQADELDESAAELRATADGLQGDVDGLYAEMEMLTVEEFMADENEIEDLALELATRVAQEYIDGSTWIPSEMLDYAWYDLSDHNN